MKLVAIALCPTFAGFLHRLYFILFVCWVRDWINLLTALFDNTVTIWQFSF